VGLTTLPCKKENVEKPPRNSARFCGGGQGLSWAVEPRKEERCFIHSTTFVISCDFLKLATFKLNISKIVLKCY
jgi:hypothetical protein